MSFRDDVRDEVTEMHRIVGYSDQAFAKMMKLLDEGEIDNWAGASVTEAADHIIEGGLS